MKAFTTLILTLIFSNSFSQITFQNSYGELGKSDYGQRVIQIANGDYIICGGQVFQDTTSGNSVGEGVIRRINNNGDEIWSINLSDTNSTKKDLYFSDIIYTSDNNLVISGLSNYGFQNNYYDFFLAKFDIDGNLIFFNNFGKPNRQWAKQVIETSDGGYILAGYNEFDGSANSLSMYVVKTNSNGFLEWEYTHPDPDTSSNAIRHQAFSIVENEQGDFIIAGSINQILHESTDFYAVKISSNGTYIWETIIDHEIGGEAREVFLKANGNILLCGWYAPNMCARPMIIELEPDGSFLNEYNLNFNSICEWSHSFHKDSLDNIVMLSFNTESNYRVTKLDTSYEVLWSSPVIYKTASSAEGNGITQSFDGGFICTGTSIINGDIQVIVFKIDKDGVLSTSNLERSNKEIDVYPNPTNDILNIRTDSYNTIKSIRIHDLYGKILIESVSNKIDVSGLINGVYILIIEDINDSQSKKIVVQ